MAKGPEGRSFNPGSDRAKDGHGENAAVSAQDDTIHQTMSQLIRLPIIRLVEGASGASFLRRFWLAKLRACETWPVGIPCSCIRRRAALARPADSFRLL